MTAMHAVRDHNHLRWRLEQAFHQFLHLDFPRHLLSEVARDDNHLARLHQITDGISITPGTSIKRNHHSSLLRHFHRLAGS